MYAQSPVAQQEYSSNIPLIDVEFDSFELNNDFGFNLRESDNATFYHDALNIEE